jgi:hypothetical protein
MMTKGIIAMSPKNNMLSTEKCSLTATDIKIDLGMSISVIFVVF